MITSCVYKLDKPTLLVNLGALGIEVVQSDDIDTLQKEIATHFKEKLAEAVHGQFSGVGTTAKFKVGLAMTALQFKIGKNSWAREFWVVSGLISPLVLGLSFFLREIVDWKNKILKFDFDVQCKSELQELLAGFEDVIKKI
ncbi:hypothetical protein PR048_000435 [Dryococelus australis]|uniref:Uncharacterized protein n=1 Tax=Dryococelus australis TaxID=614101 RepID=A0ABQ9IEL8_9NEOP|nr:hypothetical protein PR048_000435 [Dryococelus australis]